MKEGIKYVYDHKLSPKETEILLMIWDEPSTLNQLAAKLQRDKTSVSSHLTKMELKGVVEVVRMEGTTKFWRAIAAPKE